MNWEEVLKKRQFASLYFQELKSALLKIVEAMPSGEKFRTIDLKEQFINALEKPKTMENKRFNTGLTNFAKTRVERWLNSQGSKLINNSELVVKGKEGIRYMVRK